MYKKGSITVYLSLMLLLLLSLFAAVWHMGQSAGARVKAVHAVDQGLYSLFSRYDIAMLERYHMFFFDGTFGEKTLEMGNIYEILKKDTARVWENVHGISRKKELIDELKLVEGSITGYTLATDNLGNAVKAQAVAYMEAVLGVQGVRALLDNVSVEKETVIEVEKGYSLAEEHKLWETYETVKNEDMEEIQHFVEEVKQDKSKGILTLVLDDVNSVSTGYYPMSQMVSGRHLYQGMGIPSYDESCNSVKSELLFIEYMLRHFGCFTNEIETKGLNYQLEYILQGKDNDLENLKGVLNRLLIIREAVNIQKLSQNSVVMAQVRAEAAVLATLCTVPELTGVFEKLILCCRAFMDSLDDLRALLKGGKVSLWNEKMDLDYQGHLRLLLLTKDSGEKVRRCMDMMELGIRSENGKENFRLDACLYTLETRLCVRDSQNQEYELCRSYGYDME